MLKNLGEIQIIGLGNVLLQDEGAGIHVVRKLGEGPLPERVRLVEAGLAGIDLLDFFQGASEIIIVDAAEMNLAPGSVVRLAPEEIQRQERLGFSAHGFGLAEVLDLAGVLGTASPRVSILGIQPKEISWGEGLTPEVAAAVPKAIEMILEEISSQ